MDAQKGILFLLNQEVRNEEARTQLYRMLHLDHHPSQRIGENLNELRRRFSVEQVLKALDDGQKNEQWFWDRFQGLVNADRNLYKRPRGFAPKLIDAIAKAVGIDSSKIYAPDAPYTSQVIERCIGFLLDKPAGLSEQKAKEIEMKIKNLDCEPAYIQASSLAKLTEGTSLPLYFFMATPEECKSYKSFRKNGIKVIDEISNFYLGNQLHDQMCVFVKKEFPRLITYVDSEPSSFINEFHIKFRQQVLDGNSNFLNYKLPLKSYLMKTFKYFLIDKIRCLEVQLKRQQRIQAVKWKESLEHQRQTDSDIVAEEMTVEKDLLLEVILSIPNKMDSEILCDSLIDRLPLEEKKDIKRARQALLCWAPYIKCKLGKRFDGLPEGIQKRLTWYTNSLTVNFVRDIIRCDNATNETDHDRDWLAGQLGIHKKTLTKWTHLDVFPAKKSIRMIKSRIPHIKQVLNVSENIKELYEEFDNE